MSSEWRRYYEESKIVQGYFDQLKKEFPELTLDQGLLAYKSHLKHCEEVEMKDNNSKKIVESFPVIDWAIISELGLHERINNEICEPLGISIYRDSSGVSGGAVINENKIDYKEVKSAADKEIIEKMKNLGLLKGD